MSLVDIAVVAVVGVALLRGWRRGLLSQAFELGGGFGGLVAGMVLGPRLASVATQKAGLESVALTLIAIIVSVAFGQAIGYGVGRRFGVAARRLRLGPLDSAVGALFGAAVILVSFWLLGSALAQGPVGPLARSLRRSAVLRAMTDYRRPPDVVAYLARYLQTTDFPLVFRTPPPLTGRPVDLPAGRLVRRAIRRADQSTVRVVVPACGGTQLGTGWVSSKSTVVTNAHVVAGGSGVTVQQAGGNLQATVVLFDPGTDVAVLRVDGLSAPALELAARSLAEGSAGAILGFPGDAGGRLEAAPAAVQARFVASGLDIYGRRGVNRQVYELRVQVREGDSGGPFVLPSGRVAGTIFAASSSDSSRGYALTAAEIRDELSAGEDLTEAVGTGGCTH